MVICKFYQQGTCRFGNNCRFEHILPNYIPNANPILHQQHQQLSRSHQQVQFNSNEFCEMVVRDLECAEKSGQWVLSCYCPFPTKSSLLPGLEDYSPEEIRFLMYQAKSTGNVDTYRQHIQKLYQDAIANRSIFKSQSPESKALLDSVRSNTTHPFQSASGGANGSSMFGGNAQNQNQIQPQMSVFGGSSSPNVFGGGNSALANPFVAAKAPQATMFGGGSTFGGNNPQPSMFGGAANTTPANPFTNAQPPPPPYGAPTASVVQTPFGGGGTTNVPTQGAMFAPNFGGAVPTGQNWGFGGESQASPASGSIFGGANSTALNSFSFASVAQSQGLITPAPPPPPAQQPFLATPPQQPSMFGGSVQPPVQAGTSIFGGGSTPAATPTAQPVAAAPPANPFGTPTQRVKETAAPRADSALYTLLNELTEEEKAAFMAPTFSKGRIPIRPPPKELCV